MSRLVAWNEDDSKRIAGAVRVIERGALEHPFHRRTVPIISASSLVLAQYIGTTEYLGSDDQTGVASTGSGYIVNSFADTTPDTATTYDINAVYCPQLIAPDGRFWAISEDDMLYAVSGAPGFTVVSGSVNSSGGADTVSGSSTIAVSFFDNCTSLVRYVEGQQVVLMWTGNAFVIIDECCPPGLGT